MTTFEYYVNFNIQLSNTGHKLITINYIFISPTKKSRYYSTNKLFISCSLYQDNVHMYQNIGNTGVQYKYIK